MAPCVLYGSNVERLGSTPGTFANHCLSYYGLYLIGNTFFGWNCLAPWFSYPSRTAIRRKFNLEASYIFPPKMFMVLIQINLACFHIVLICRLNFGYVYMSVIFCIAYDFDSVTLYMVPFFSMALQ